LKNKKVFIYVDGASRGNPGPAGAGVVIRDEKKKTLKEFYKYLGQTTNNVAEYNALIYGLQEALILRADEVVVSLDSELVSKQINGEYRVKEATIKQLFEDALRLLSGFKKFEIRHIDRSENREADRLANKAVNLAGLI
jgi:ribonuclease HI